MLQKYDFSKVGKAADERIKKGILPGAVIGVDIGGQRVYEYVGGCSDVESGVSLKKDAIFRLASMTKPITVAAALMLADRGKISVKDKISKYFPEYAKLKVGRLTGGGEIVFEKNAEREITIEDILTHSSGLGSGTVGDEQFKRFDRARFKTLSELVGEYSSWYLDFSPGEKQFYSAAVALDVVAAIVELVSGTDYETFVRKNIFEPLGMKDTGYNLTDEQYSRVVTMYKLSDAADKITRLNLGREGHVGFPAGGISGSSCLFSTMEDYSRFARMLLGEGKFDGMEILSRAAVNSIHSPKICDNFAGMDGYSHWGYAVRVRNKTEYGIQELTKGSYGWSGAYNTHFWVDPKLNLTGVFMSNMDNAGGAGAITAFEFECNVMRSLGYEK